MKDGEIEFDAWKNLCDRLAFIHEEMHKDIVNRCLALLAEREIDKKGEV